jgi:hypothetical protein
MRSFSIIPNSSQSVIEQYSVFLSREVYMNMKYPYDVNDPLFLQQLGVLQAEGIRRAINNNRVVAHSGLQEINKTVVNSADYIGDKIGDAANMITSSLDKGFTTLNYSLIKIDGGLQTANVHLSNINGGINMANTHLLNIDRGIHDVNDKLEVLGGLIGQGFSRLYYALRQTDSILNDILKELRIPETQRERSRNIEEGTKFLTLALQDVNDRYFDDAFDKFNNALTFEKTDWYSWFNIGVIHLRSKRHINPQKAIDALNEAVHYGRAEALYRKNAKLESKMDETYLLLAEAYYLQNDFRKAVSETERCLHLKGKADFMKVKYLSAINGKESKQEAAKILSKLTEENPYIILQVLEDFDILRNEFVTELREDYRNNAVLQAKALLKQCEGMIKKSLVRNVIEEIEKLIQTNTYLDAVEAIYKLNEKRTWPRTFLIPDGFSGTVSAFIAYERQRSVDTGITGEWWEKLSLLENNKVSSLITNTNIPSDVLDKISRLNVYYMRKIESGDVPTYLEDLVGEYRSYPLNMDIAAHRNISYATLQYLLSEWAKLDDFHISLSHSERYWIEYADGLIGSTISKNPNITDELKKIIKKRINQMGNDFSKGQKKGYYGIEDTYYEDACYIATACYGSAYINEIDRFRDYRDNYMVNSRMGRYFIAFYYFTSPPVAKIIAKHEWLKKTIRKFILSPILKRLPKSV